MKQWIALVLCGMVALSPAACGGQAAQSTNVPKNDGAMMGGDTPAWVPENNPPGSQNVQIPNPFVACDSMEAAENLAGFEMTVPPNLEGYEERHIQAIKNQLIQIQLTKEKAKITIRKGSGKDEVSGDYTLYAKEELIEVNNSQVSLKGTDREVHLATWVDDEYAYSVMVTAGTDIDRMKEIVKTVK